MSFELDPLFHTETMVKILKEQGNLQLAMKVCGKILEKDPANLKVRDMRESLRSPFPRVERPLPENEDEITEPGATVEELQARESAPSVSEILPEEMERLQKLEKLNELLRKVQERS